MPLERFKEDTRFINRFHRPHSLNRWFEERRTAKMHAIDIDLVECCSECGAPLLMWEETFNITLAPGAGLQKYVRPTIKLAHQANLFCVLFRPDPNWDTQDEFGGYDIDGGYVMRLHAWPEERDVWRCEPVQIANFIHDAHMHHKCHTHPHDELDRIERVFDDCFGAGDRFLL